MAPVDSQELIRVLREARDLIAEPDHWQPSGYAANAVGRFVPVGSPHAVRFSTVGAVIHACRGSRELFRAVRLVTDSDPSLKPLDAALTHDESLVLIDRALAALGGAAPAYVPKQSGFVTRHSPQSSQSSAVSTTLPLPDFRRSGR